MADIWRITLCICWLYLGISLGQMATVNVDCSNVAAGTRMWGCKAYHECQADGSSVFVECGPGLVYNEVSGKCEQASEVETPCGRSYRRECRDYGPPFGKIAVKDYTDPGTGLPCQYFFTCANGHFYGTQKCQGLQVFDEVLQYCVKPEAAPVSCNPFGPQVANVREVRRHWWKSEAAGISRSAKQPWWKAKNSKSNVRKSVAKNKHWLTRSAAARKSKSLYPRFEKMLVKNSPSSQNIASTKKQKTVPPRRKVVQPLKKSSHPTTKKLPPVAKVSTKEKIVASKVKKVPTEKTSLPVSTTTVQNEDNITVTSSTSPPSSPGPKPDHPWNAKDKSSSRSIVPREKSPSSSTS